MSRPAIMPPAPLDDAPISEILPLPPASEPPPGWRPPSHRADRIESAVHVEGDFWCACQVCTGTRMHRTRLLSKWKLDDLCAAQLRAEAENDNACPQRVIKTVRPPRAARKAG